jgi:hypothetical protein
LCGVAAQNKYKNDFSEKSLERRWIMSAELIAGAAAFVVFFGLWVVVPNFIHKKKATLDEDEE